SSCFWVPRRFSRQCRPCRYSHGHGRFVTPERAIKCPCLWIFLRVGAMPGRKEGVYLPNPLGEVPGTGSVRSLLLWLWKGPVGAAPEDPRGRPLPALGRTRSDRGRSIERGGAVAGVLARPRRGVQRFPSVRPR